MNYAFTHRTTDQSPQHHRTSPPQRDGIVSPFHLAKAQAVQLIKDSDLFSCKAQQCYFSTVQRMAASIRLCPSTQKGQIYLLLCQSALSIQIPFLKLPLPSQFAHDAFVFLGSLMDTELQPVSRKVVSQIYRGRFKGTTQRVNAKQGIAKLKDLLLIQRYDRLLVTLMQELQAVQWKEKLQFSRQMVLFLRDTYRLAQRYFQAEGFKQYKANIQAIISKSNPSKLIKRQSQSMSLGKNYLIIDSSEIAQSVKTLRKNPMHASILSVHTNRSSSSKRSSRKVSNNQLIEFETLSQQLHFRKSAIAHRSLNRPSGSSNSSLRSSVYMNHNFTATAKHASNFINRQAALPRSSNKIIPRESELKVKEKRVGRKSRFQLISKLEEETLRKEFEMYEAQEQKHSSEEDHEQAQIRRDREGKLRTRIKTSKIFSCFQDVDRTNWHQLQPFFLFLQDSHQLHLVRVEQLQNRQIIQSNSDAAEARIKIKLSQPQVGLYLSSSWSFEDNESIELEQMCISFLIQHIQPSKRGRRLILQSIAEGALGREGNIVQVQETDEGMLMGFIRKISTFFIQQVKYSRKQLSNCYQYAVRKRLMTEQSHLTSVLEVKSRLMNYDLSMSFQEQEFILAKRGSVIHYIQTQDPSNTNISAQLTYKLTYQYCTLKDCEQARIQRIWASKTYQQFWYQHKKKKGRRKASSRIHKTIVGEESLKKLRRTHHNKSSIKLSNKNLEADLIFQNQHKGNSRFASKIDVIVSEKKLSHLSQTAKEQRTRKEVDRAKRTRNFVETVRTEKGYKLVRKSAVADVEGVRYNEYQGYLERNPQLLRMWKDQQLLVPQSNYLNPTLSIRGSGNSQVSNTRLISFIKPLLNENDYSFLGYLVSDVKIMNFQANRCIFVETYWEKMQKQFIFSLSCQFFQQLTDINTNNFKAQPFLQGEEPTLKKKEKEKRTSVMNTLLRHKHNDHMYDSTQKLHSNSRDNPHGPKLNQSAKAHQFKFWQSKNKFSQTFKTDKFHDSLNAFKHSKTLKKTQLKRQIVNNMKNRLAKNLSFIWKDHTIRLIIKNSGSSPKTFQSEEIASLEFEGRELAVKNVYESEKNKQIAAATELILIKYRENNLTNLNYFTQEGLNQVSLEHIFIKNNSDLYGRYQSILELSTLPLHCNIGEFYRDRNLFFEKPSEKDSNKLSNRLKQTVNKYSLRQQQKRFKYVQILSYAKECCLPFDLVQQKRKRTVKQSFVVPNRFKTLQVAEELLHISIQTNFVKVSTLLGQEIIVFSLQKIQIYLPFIRRLEHRRFKEVFLRRVLQDQDVVRLCLATQDPDQFS